MNQPNPENVNQRKALEEKYKFLYIYSVKPRGYTMVQHKVFDIFDGICMFVNNQYEYCLFFTDRTYYALDFDVWIMHYFEMLQKDVVA